MDAANDMLQGLVMEIGCTGLLPVELDQHATRLEPEQFAAKYAIKLKKALLDLGVEVKLHNVSYSDMSKIITDSVRASVLVVGTPTYDAYPYPKVWGFVNEVQGKRFPVNTVALFGTYGWGGGGVKRLQKMFTEMKKELLEPIIRVKARASEEEGKQIKELAKIIAERVK